MVFDFTTHLSKLFSIPPSEITIQFFTPGVVNVTVRASFTPPVDLTQFGHPHSVLSVILKYLPPYVFSEQDLPLNTIRQDIEARALILLDSKSEPTLPATSLFTKYSNIKTPRFIHHDPEKHVLIMTDLGSSAITIDNWLTQEPAPNPEDVERIAKDLGRFQAEFVIATSEPNVELLSLFPSNSGLIDILYEVDSLKAILSSHDVPDAEILIKRVEDAVRDFGKMDLCLGQVDLWRNNVLIDSDKNICLVDWEYFGLSNASCEMSLLGGLLSLDIDETLFFLIYPYGNSAIITLDLMEFKFYGRCEETHHHIYQYHASKLWSSSRRCSFSTLQTLRTYCSWSRDYQHAAMEIMERRRI